MPKPFTIANFNRLYPTNAACLESIFLNRYEQLDVCPGCMQKGKFSRLKKRKCYSCQWCGYQIYPLAGTIFHKSRTPLKLWFFAMYLFASSKNGVSACELQRQLGVTQKCAWRMAKQIRTLFTEQPTTQLSGTVEADESWFGHKGKKVPVVGLVERGGKIITKMVTDVDTATLIPYIERYVAKGSLVTTDEHLPYKRLRTRGYSHATVNHKRWQWYDKNTGASTNTLEGHWGLVKRAIRGTYGSVSAKYVPLYLAEFSWRRNHASEAMFPLLVARAAKPSQLTF